MNLNEQIKRLENQIMWSTIFRYSFGTLVVIIGVLSFYNKYEKEQIRIEQNKRDLEWIQQIHELEKNNENKVLQEQEKIKQFKQNMKGIEDEMKENKTQ